MALEWTEALTKIGRLKVRKLECSPREAVRNGRSCAQQVSAGVREAKPGRELRVIFWLHGFQIHSNSVSHDECLHSRPRAHFSEVQLSELSFAVGVINLWNRLNIGFRNVPGSAEMRV